MTALAVARPWWRMLVAGLALTGCAAPSATRLPQVLHYELGRGGDGRPNYRCTIGAHRGASVEHRENTLAALRAAENDPRFAFVEFDVQFTRDRQIVLFHDQRLLRIYGKFTSVGEATYDELAALTGGDIARHEEAMAIVTKPINLEIKSQGDYEEDRLLVDAVMADLRARGRDRDVMISSISPGIVRYLNERYPAMPTGQIFWLTSSTYLHWDSLTENLFEKITETQADYLMLHVANLRNIDDLLKLKPKDKTIMFWDFDDRMYLVHKDRTDRLWGPRTADRRAGVRRIFGF